MPKKIIPPIPSHRFSVAPMLDWTDRYYRFFARLISKKVQLYTEMISTKALLHGNTSRLLCFHEEEHPLVLQLGGSDPKELAKCAKLGESYGYDEINLNLGCPSPKVSQGFFGASLMQNPELAQSCLKAMVEAVSIPVTIKHRLGLGREESYDYLRDFVGMMQETGCTTFVVHARNAILGKLSPRQNRTVPPLKYNYVYRLKQDFPRLIIVLNGGVKTHEEAAEHLKQVDGVMVGRNAYHDPYGLLSQVDALYFGFERASPRREEILESLTLFLENEVREGRKISSMTRHILGLYHGVFGATKWRHGLTNARAIHENDPSLLRKLVL